MTYQERRRIPLASERTPESVSREKNDRREILESDTEKLHTQQYATPEHLDTGLPAGHKMEYKQRQANGNSTICLHLQTIRIKLEMDKSYDYMPNKRTNIQDNKTFFAESFKDTRKNKHAASPTLQQEDT
jgi:hypothetical protein